MSTFPSSVFQPRSYLVNPAQFGLPSATRPRWLWPLHGEADLLRLAAAQHEIVKTASAAMARERVSKQRLAHLLSVSYDSLKKGFRGERQFSPKELAALAAVAPDAWPDPALVHNSVVYATVSLQRQVVASGGAAGPLALLSPDDLAALTHLAALAGVTGVEQTTSSKRADAEIEQAATTALVGSARALAQARGLPDVPDPSHNLLLRVAEADADAVLVGDYSEDGIVLSGTLARTWPDEVETRGWSRLGDHFVVAVVSLHADGRPDQVLVLDLTPQRWVASAADANADDLDWEYRTRPATVSWDGQTCQVIVGAGG